MYSEPGDNSSGTTLVAKVCIESVKTYRAIGVQDIVTFVSVTFLILTIGIYIYLPQLRDVPGKCYLCMCISQALGLASYESSQLTRGRSDVICTSAGLITYAFMMATYFWLNVICINAYRLVRDPCILKTTKLVHFVMFNCYAWGGMLVCLTFVLVAEFYGGEIVTPGFTNGAGWFSGKEETWYYYNGPVAVLMTANVILFILSAIQMWCRSNELRSAMSTRNNVKYQFLLMLALFVVMGVSWILDVADLTLGQKNNIIWDTTVLIYYLQGLILFVLLVILRKSVRICFRCATTNDPEVTLDELQKPDDKSNDQEILA